MRPKPLRSNERTFEMRADDVRVGTILWNLAQCRRQVVLWRSDERRLIRGHSALEQRLPRLPITLCVGRKEIDACKPVDLQVDETRSGDSGSIRRAQPDPGDLAVGDLDVAGDELALDERCLDTESHF